MHGSMTIDDLDPSAFQALPPEAQIEGVLTLRDAGYSYPRIKEHLGKGPASKIIAELMSPGVRPDYSRPDGREDPYLPIALREDVCPPWNAQRVRVGGISGGERSMWASVLSLAIEDAMGGPKLTTGVYAVTEESAIRFIKQSRAYFNLRNKDFTMVCRMAGVDAQAVVKRTDEMFAERTVEDVLSSMRGRARTTETA